MEGRDSIWQLALVVNMEVSNPGETEKQRLGSIEAATISAIERVESSQLRKNDSQG